MRSDFEGARTFATMMGCVVVLGSLCAVAPVRAQDTGAQDTAAPDDGTHSQTTTTQTTNTPDSRRVETRTTQGHRQTTSSAPAAPAPAPRPAPPPPTPRTDIIYVELIGGYSFVNMRALRNPENFFPEIVPISGSGYAAGLAAGIRLSILTIGGRATLASYAGFEVGTVAAELTLRLPTGVVEPWIRAGFGYGWLGEANYEFPGRSETSVYGYVIQGGLGVDVYLGKVVSIGGGFDLDILNMSRQPLPGADPPASPGEFDLTQDGNAVGLQIRAHGTVTFHF